MIGAFAKRDGDIGRDWWLAWGVRSWRVCFAAKMFLCGKIQRIAGVPHAHEVRNC